MFFDDLYTKSDNVWGEEIDDIIGLGLNYLKGRDILDLGVGDGRNSIYLLKQGFNITGVDISKVGLDNIEKKISKYTDIGVFTPIQSDLKNYKIDRKYNNIVCNYVLHFLDKQDAMKVINSMKGNTVLGGINILSGFLDQGDLNINKQNGVFHPDEIKNIYKGWDIIHYEENNEEVTEVDENGKKKFNYTFNIIAKKN